MNNMIVSSKLIALVCLLLFLAACGEAAEDGAEDSATATPFPTFAFVAPTNPPVFDQTANEEATEAPAEVEEAVALNPTQVVRGQGRYEALECGSCHGANGEGGEDGNSLLEFALSQEDFITFMRTGGDVGTDHQYSTDRLSENGARNLYQYVLSLAQDA